MRASLVKLRLPEFINKRKRVIATTSRTAPSLSIITAIKIINAYTSISLCSSTARPGPTRTKFWHSEQLNYKNKNNKNKNNLLENFDFDSLEIGSVTFVL